MSSVIFYNRRQLILSENTFSGSGQFASHYFGRNNATWEDLRLSIAAIMNSNMFGIPTSGPDVCGYYGNSNLTDEICVRWV